VASNFPVDRVSAPYADLTTALVEVTGGYGPVAQELMFRDTAASFLPDRGLIHPGPSVGERAELRTS
jgi:hypothetical protein